MPLFDRARRAGSGAGDGVLDRCREAAAEVNALEPRMRELPAEALRAMTTDLRRRLADGADPAALLPEAFATVREAAWRTIGQRLVDEQIMGGVAMHLGTLVEMKTGEGKTLMITLPVYLNALGGQGVHVITANEYLAARDTEWMGPVYRALGLECGLISSAGGDSEYRRRRAAYAADVTYGTVSLMACDYLYDNRVWEESQVLQRGRRFLIVDEADLVMIDEARQTAHQSMRMGESAGDGDADGAEEETRLVRTAARFAVELVRDQHYTVDERRRLVTLTDAGVGLVEDRFAVTDLFVSARNDRLRVSLENALKAKEVYQRDRDYVVSDGAIRVVDAQTGRVRERVAYESGLARAIEAKEGLAVESETEVVASITVHDYLRRYDRLAAVTGVVTEVDGYREIYGLETVRIPTHRPVLRVDRPVVVYRTDAARLAAVLEAVAATRAAGRPVLVAAGSIAQSEQVCAALAGRGIPHQVLNARNHQDEALIIAGSGRVGAVTVVTRMAGRGVDIRLGGDDPEEHDAVVRSGGLYVLALEVYETRRLELHVRGRAGRRGDPGDSDIFLSCEDGTLAGLFGPKTVRQLARGALTSGLPGPGDQTDRALTLSLTSRLDEVTRHQSQRLVRVVRFEDVVGVRREEVYRLRRGFVAGREALAQWYDCSIPEVVDRHVAAWADREAGLASLRAVLGEFYPAEATAEATAGLSPAELRETLQAGARRAYERRKSQLGPKVMTEIERRVAIEVIDRCWSEYLAQTEDIAALVTLQSLTGNDFTRHYQVACDREFVAFLERIQKDSVGYLFNIAVQIEMVAEPQAQTEN